MWWNEDRATWGRIAKVDGAIMWKSPLSGVHVTDEDGRPIIPRYDRTTFWAMPINGKVDYLFGKVCAGKFTAGWVAERLCYFGLVDEEHYLEAKNILMRLYEYYGGESVEEVKVQLREIGVKV